MATTAVATVIAGMLAPDEMTGALDRVVARIPPELWTTLVDEGHVEPEAPRP